MCVCERERESLSVCVCIIVSVVSVSLCLWCVSARVCLASVILLMCVYKRF